ncbi:MAG: DUF1697 domain-containing protein [Nocardioides sp.]
MPTYVAFLRAINLGPTRKFPKEAIKAAVESVGATGVETYLNTGNVRLTTRLRSPARVEQALEEAFLADRAFAVPTVALTPGELLDIVADVDALWAEFGEPAAHSVTLFKEPPETSATRAVEALDLADRAVVRGRAAHVLLTSGFHDSRLLNAREFGALGVGTARYATVLRELATRWCG